MGTESRASENLPYHLRKTAGAKLALPREHEIQALEEQIESIVRDQDKAVDLPRLKDLHLRLLHYKAKGQDAMTYLRLFQEIAKLAGFYVERKEIRTMDGHGRSPKEMEEWESDLKILRGEKGA